MDNRVINLNPGPAALPLPVLEKIQQSFLNYKGSGMSIIEISHRSKPFEDVINDAVLRAKRLLNLGDNYHVLFLQGGASLQFSMVPMNFLPSGQSADYVNTGTWATKAIKEAKLLGKSVNVVASSEDKNFSYIPQNISFNKDAAYIHITSNNTIKGTQWSKFPDPGNVPMIADMSSDMLSRPFDASKFGLIYAGAQKNLGPAGVCMIIIRADMLQREIPNLPTMLRYSTFSESNSLYNTPPCFAIYTVQLVLEWIEETIGGLAKIEEINTKKADIIYKTMDDSNFYRGTAQKDSRSKMNITFRLPSDELEKKFIAEATSKGFIGLKGHRSVGGCRASIYNAIDIQSVEKLADFMKEFAKKV